MKDDEYNALERHLFDLRSKAVAGDKEAINEMFLWIDSMLKEKRKGSATRKKTGGMSKTNKAKEQAILLLAVPAYKRAIKVDPAFRTVDPWDATVAEVTKSALQGIELTDFNTGKTKTVEIETKDFVTKTLNKNRSFIEGVPSRSD